MATTVRRETAGTYTVSDGARAVIVQRNPYLRPVWAGQWGARADWDGGGISDPVTTKARAVEIAHSMLEDARTTEEQP